MIYRGLPAGFSPVDLDKNSHFYTINAHWNFFDISCEMNFLRISSRITSLVEDSNLIYSKYIRIATRVSAQTYDGTIDGLRSMLIGKFSSLQGPVAKKEAADKVIREATDAINHETDTRTKNAYLNFVIAPFYAKTHPYNDLQSALALVKNSVSLMEEYKAYSGSEPSWEKLFPKEKEPAFFSKRNDILFWARPNNYAKLETVIGHASASGIKAIDADKFRTDVEKLLASADFMTLDGSPWTPSVKDIMTKEGISFIVHPHSTWAAQFMGNGGKLGVKTGLFRDSHSTTCVNWMQGNMLPSYHKTRGNIYMIVDGSKNPGKDADWAWVIAINPNGSIQELSDSNNKHKTVTDVRVLGKSLEGIVDRIKPHAKKGNRIKKDSDRYETMIREGKSDEAKTDMLKNPDMSHIAKLIYEGHKMTDDELKIIAKANDNECLKALSDKAGVYSPLKWFQFIGNPSGMSAYLLNNLGYTDSLKLPNAAEHAWFVYNDPENFHMISGK